MHGEKRVSGGPHHYLEISPQEVGAERDGDIRTPVPISREKKKAAQEGGQ